MDPDDGIVWKFQSSPQNSGTTLYENDRYTFGNNNETLVIDPVRLEDTGTYSLTASNEGGSHTSSVAIDVVGKR